MPGISITEAERLLQVTDRVILGFPEVSRVLGKAGRADTATDPAPLSMFETVVELKPKSEWRRKDTWYSSWAPDWLLPALRRITPDHISREELVQQMNDALRLPGLSNAWTMPIKARIDMLSTGIRTPLGQEMVEGFSGVLSAQAMFPVLSQDEMAGHYGESDISKAVRTGQLTGRGGAWDLISKRVEAVPEYREMFDRVIGEREIDFTDISNVIAEFIAFEWRSAG